MADQADQVEPGARQPEVPPCDWCDYRPGRYTCAGCKKKCYCSKSCQERAWEMHIFHCDSKKPIKSYHRLSQAVYRDLLPTDTQTLEDWGFERANFSGDVSPGGPIMLFGVYTGLIKYKELPAKTLDQWRRKGVLLQEIKKIYEAIPEHARGGYYPWLLKNEFVLDRSQPMPLSAVDIINRYMRDGWNFALEDPSASDSTIRQTIDSWPPSKQECLILCGLLLNHTHPSPSQAGWVHFGFCVGDQYSELCAGRLYQKLLTRTSFQEFSIAYEASAMVALFREKGLISDPDYIYLSKQFEDVMSGSGHGTFKSSWYLKQFVQVQMEKADQDFKMVPAVRVDYGFVNCTTTTDFGVLLGIYQEYFKSSKNDCLALHAACIKGELFDYLGTFPGVKSIMKEPHRRLLKNLYPLPEF